MTKAYLMLFAALAALCAGGAAVVVAVLELQHAL
jgi:hypothetical protein